MLHGVARRITDAPTITAIGGVYVAKYGSGFADPAESKLLAVRPVTVIAATEAPNSFATTATRWQFDA